MGAPNSRLLRIAEEAESRVIATGVDEHGRPYVDIKITHKSKKLTRRQQKKMLKIRSKLLGFNALNWSVTGFYKQEDYNVPLITDING